MKDRLIRFMYGRYGVDGYSKFLLGISIFMMVLSVIFRNGILDIMGIALLGYMYFRMFSRNIQKRYSENIKYCNIKNRFLNFFKHFGRDMKIRKTHHIYKCPNCKQKIKIPRGKGKVAIRCPKCYTEFIKNS